MAVTDSCARDQCAPTGVVAVGLILQPCAAVGDNLCGKQLLTGLINFTLVVCARGRTSWLTMTRSAPLIMNVPCSVIGEIPHENIGFFDFTRVPV